jgi:hypothetical protein
MSGLYIPCHLTLALHAALLGFRHPRTGAWLDLERAWPDDLIAYRDVLRSATLAAWPPASEPSTRSPS